MEDSYTVHKRRKANAAASRKSDKTPEPMETNAEQQVQDNSQLKIDNNTDDEDEARRRRMEQMAEDTERMEEETTKKQEPIVPPESDANNDNTINKFHDDPNDNMIDQQPTKVEQITVAKKKSNKTNTRRSSDTSDIDEWNDRIKETRRPRSPGPNKTNKKLKIKKLSSKSQDRANKSQENLQSNETGEILKKPKRKSTHRNDTEEPTTKPLSIKSQDYDVDEESQDNRSVEKKCLSGTKKQIIPISNETLIDDFNRAQKQYLMRERSILETDPLDVDHLPDGVRKRTRKISPDETMENHEDLETEQDPSPDNLNKTSWSSWFRFNIFRTKQIDEKQSHEEMVETIEQNAEKKVTLLDFVWALKDIFREFQAFIEQNPEQVRVMRILRNSCVAELIIVIIYCGLGAFLFRFTEGAFEMFYKCGVKRVKRDFLDSLWNYSHNLKEEEWKSMARRKLMEFEEQLHEAHEAGVHSYSGQKSWSFLNAVVYCLTVITTIGRAFVYFNLVPFH